jgi:hypothetical protein
MRSNSKPADEVVFDELIIVLRCSECSAPMTIEWKEIVALDVSALQLPDRVLRILALAFPNGEMFEVTQDCVGYDELVAELCRRFGAGPDFTVASMSLPLGSDFHLEVSQ